MWNFPLLTWHDSCFPIFGCPYQILRHCGPSDTRVKCCPMNQVLRTLGRPRKPVYGEVLRELTVADLALLDRDRGIKPFRLKKLRDAHHGLARLVAEGRTGGEISAITGYSQSRISILQADPAFAELVSHYREHLEELADEVAADGFAKLAALRNDLIEEAHDRVLDAPELITFDQLLDGIKTSADRTGLGPSSRSTNLNFNVDLASRRAEGRQRAERLSAASPALADTPGQQQGLLPPADRDSAPPESFGTPDIAPDIAQSPPDG